MVKISGKHFIFTRVEAEYSPKGVAGFQSYFSSKDLSVQDLEVMEDCVKCFLPSEKTVVRKQFFRLPSGDFAFVHTLLESHPQISDRSRRGGIFLAHGIVISESDFAKIFFNPFHVFDNFRFLSSAQDMIDHFQQGIKEQPCVIVVDPYLPIIDNGASSQYALRYYQLAADQKKQVQPLLLVGQNESVEKFLRAVIQFAPLRSRPFCTFDTNLDGCQLATSNFWAIGSSFPKDEFQNFIHLNRELPDNLTGSEPQGDMYYEWLKFALTHTQKEIASHVETAQILAEIFVNKHSFERIQSLNQDSCYSFFLAHNKRITGYLVQTVAKLTSENIAKYLVKYIFSSQPDYRKIVSIASSKIVTRHYLSPIIRDWLLASAPVFDFLKSGDWINLQNFAKEAKDMMLLFWASVMGNKNKLRKISIENMSESDYQTVLLLLNKPVHPMYFVSNSLTQMRQLMSKVQPVLHDFSNDVFIDFASEIFKMESLTFIDELSPRINSLDNKSLTLLESRLPSSLPRDSQFAKMVRARRKELGRPSGLKGLFYRPKVK